MPTLLAAPPLAPLFSGALFRDILEGQYGRALVAVHNLEPHHWQPLMIEPVEGEAVEWETPDPASAIVAAYDVALSVIDWDAPHIEIGATADQRMRAVITFPTDGPAAPLTWVPSSRSIGSPPARFGFAHGRVTVLCEADTLEAGDMDRAIRLTRRHIDAQLMHMWLERQEWRPAFARRIRDAAIRRRQLLDGITAAIV